MIQGFSNPWALAWAALAIPIIVAYMLKARRTPHVVSSTFLWKRADVNVAASRPWQRLRSSVLLLMQLLSLSLLVLVLAGPFRAMEGIESDHLVLVIDASGSMLATDEDPDRIGAAKREALDLLETLPASSIASVISAGPNPRVVVSSTVDRAAVRQAINRLVATEGASKIDEAMLLAESLETPNHPATIALISDGGITPQEADLIPPGTVFRQVGRQATNLGIIGLVVGESPGGFRAFVTVSNVGSKPRSAELFLEIDSVPVVSSRVVVAAGSKAEKSFELGARTGKLTARLDVNDDLAQDDRAFAVLERTRPRRIQLVTPDNLFLEKLLQQLPGAEVDISRQPAGTSGYDLVVYDRVAAPEGVKTAAMFVSPTTAPKGVVIKGEILVPSISFLASNEPLLDQVDLSDVSIARAKAVAIEGSKTLVGTEGSPLVATWTEGILRRVWIGFDLHESNLPVQVAFPILGDHLLGWLTGAEAQPARHAGQAIELAPVAGASVVRIETPDSKRVSIDPGQKFTETHVSGFYRIAFLGGANLLAERTIALSFPPGESDLLPREVVTSPDPSRPGLVDSARRPLVLPFLVLLLALLMIEWWWAHGRPIPRVVGA